MATKRRTKAASNTTDAAAPADAVLRLPGALQIRNADEFAVLLRTAGTRALRIDASDVAQVDTAGLQLLVAAVAAARRDGVKPEWLAASPALCEAARRLGLAALLELPAAAAG